MFLDKKEEENDDGTTKNYGQKANRKIGHSEGFYPIVQNQIIERTVANITSSDAVVEVFEGFGFPEFSGSECIFAWRVETVFLGISLQCHTLTYENGCFFIQKNTVLI